jgi:hypothetical protein
MDMNNILNKSWNIIKKVIIIDIIIILLSIVLWVWLGKNYTISIADMIFILGSLITGCGAYFIRGAKIGSVDYIYFQSRLASQIDYHDRSRQEMEYIEKSYYNATIFFIAGLVAIGVSVIVYKIVG